MELASVWRAVFGALVLAGVLGAAPARGETYAVVDAVQMPAWVERGGLREPLVAGQALRSRDKLVTGAEARVLIQLSEGSAVKLGENAELSLNALGRRENKVFTAALDVARGAFRFTTGIFGRLQQKRAVNVRIATITAGIRGTDLWGKADEERDLVCLLEGRITVLHPQDEVREMSEPNTFYVAPKGATPQPVAGVDAAQLREWAAQTEVQPGGGTARRGGRWQVRLASVDSEVAALDLYDRARAAGYPVRIKPIRADGTYRYELRVSQLATPADAEALARRLGREFKVETPGVTR